MPIKPDGSYESSGLERLGTLVKNATVAHVAILTSPRDPMTKGYREQFASEAGCWGWPVDLEMWFLHTLILGITSPFVKK